MRVTTKLQTPVIGKNSGNLHIITSKKKRMKSKRSEIKIKISMEDDPQTSLKKTTQSTQREVVATADQGALLT